MFLCSPIFWYRTGIAYCKSKICWWNSGAAKSERQWTLVYHVTTMQSVKSGAISRYHTSSTWPRAVCLHGRTFWTSQRSGSGSGSGHGLKCKIYQGNTYRRVLGNHRDDGVVEDRPNDEKLKDNNYEVFVQGVASFPPHRDWSSAFHKKEYHHKGIKGQPRPGLNGFLSCYIGIVALKLL